MTSARSSGWRRCSRSTGWSREACARRAPPYGWTCGWSRWTARARRPRSTSPTRPPMRVASSAWWTPWATGCGATWAASRPWGRRRRRRRRPRWPRPGRTRKAGTCWPGANTCPPRPHWNGRSQPTPVSPWRSSAWPRPTRTSGTRRRPSPSRSARARPPPQARPVWDTGCARVWLFSVASRRRRRKATRSWSGAFPTTWRRCSTSRPRRRGRAT